MDHASPAAEPLEPERSLRPAAQAPDAEAGTTPFPGAAHRLSGPIRMSSAALLGLQQTAGNGAVSQMMAWHAHTAAGQTLSPSAPLPPTTIARETGAADMSAESLQEPADGDAPVPLLAAVQPFKPPPLDRPTPRPHTARSTKLATPQRDEDAEAGGGILGGFGPASDREVVLQRVPLEEGPPLAPGNYRYGQTIVSLNPAAMRSTLTDMAGREGLAAETTWQQSFVADMRAQGGGIPTRTPTPNRR